MIIRKKKVVIDTNIMISSLWGGKPYEIIKKWNDGHFILIVSQQILNEYLEVFNRFNISEDVLEVLTILFTNTKNTVIINPKSKITLIKEDPDDNKFLECAVDGNADYIISGDKHLLKCLIFKHCKIVRPSDFLVLIK